MLHNNPGNYPDPMPPMGEPCPAPEAMPSRRSAAEMAAEILALRNRVATLEDELQKAKGNTKATCSVCGRTDWWGEGWQGQANNHTTCSDECRAKEEK